MQRLPAPWLFVSMLTRAYTEARSRGKGAEARGVITSSLEDAASAMALVITQQLTTSIREANAQLERDVQRLVADTGQTDIGIEPEEVAVWENRVLGSGPSSIAHRVASAWRQLEAVLSVQGPALSTIPGVLVAGAVDSIIKPVAEATGISEVSLRLPDPVTIGGMFGCLLGLAVFLRGGARSETAAAAIVGASLIALFAGPRITTRFL